jgi:hypothetical protein
MSQGFSSQLGIDTVDPVTKGYEFDHCQITKTATIVDASGIRGSRSHHSERTRAGNTTIAGMIELYPSAADLAALLPLVLGGTPSSTTYPLADSLSDFYVTVDKVAQVFTYAGCKVDKATFSGSAGQAMKLALEIHGQSEAAAAAGSFPVVTFHNTPPLLFTDSVLTLVGAARQVMDWTLVIDNKLAVRYANSTTATSITPMDREISFQCTNPFTADELDLYGQNPAGAAATLALTNSPTALTFAFAALQFPDIGPSVDGRSEIQLKLNGIARMAGSTRELVTTLALS